MADTRTPAQKAADDNLTKAVDHVCQVYGYVDDGTINVEYLLVVDQIIVQTDSEASGFVTVYKDGHMKWVSILGLLRAATLRAEAEFNEGRAE